MTSAISRAPPSGAHAHGFAKPLKGDAPVEGFEALFAAAAGAALAPMSTPVAGDGGRAGEHARPVEPAEGDDKASPQGSALPQGFQIVASTAPLPAEVGTAEPRATPPSTVSRAVCDLPAANPLPARMAPALEIANADAAHPGFAPTPPVSQTIVANVASGISHSVAGMFKSQKGSIADDRAPPVADPPHAARAAIASEIAASHAAPRPESSAEPLPIHMHAGAVSTVPPSSPEPTPSPVARARLALSPRALVQAAMVEVVRSPGRGRMPSPEEASAPAADATPPQAQQSESPVSSAAVATPAVPVSPNTQIQAPPIVDEAAVADAAMTIASPIVAQTSTTKAGASSRAAADIARQRQFALASTDAPAPAADGATETGSAFFETLIAMRKAGGTLEGNAPSTVETPATSPAASSGAWFSHLPSSTSPAITAASSLAMPRAFDQTAWSAALARQVTASAIAAARETTVRIKPDGLGPIEVRVRVESQHVDVRFAIEHPVTMNMVRDALPDLQKMLAQSGLNLGGAQIAQQNAGGRNQAAPGEPSAASFNDDESAPPIGGALEARPRVRVGLLDDFV
jgi:flagellar hook-length control protein FliK